MLQYFFSDFWYKPGHKTNFSQKIILPRFSNPLEEIKEKLVLWEKIILKEWKKIGCLIWNLVAVISSVTKKSPIEF
jgi:hypothetical protein